jgi:hypothetical protein
MAIEQLQDAVARVVGGDAAAVATLRSGTHAELVDAYAAAGPQVLRPAAVVRVLEALRSEEISPSQAQDWASFVRWGSLSGSGPESRADVEIEYDPGYETVVADAVARLDELGDIVHGTITPAEMEQLIARLR